MSAGIEYLIGEIYGDEPNVPAISINSDDMRPNMGGVENRQQKKR